MARGAVRALNEGAPLSRGGGWGGTGDLGLGVGGAGDTTCRRLDASSGVEGGTVGADSAVSSEAPTSRACVRVACEL